MNFIAVHSVQMLIKVSARWAPGRLLSGTWVGGVNRETSQRVAVDRSTLTTDH